MKKLLSYILSLFLVLGFVLTSNAYEVNLTFTFDGFYGGTGVYQADLTGYSDLTQIGSITIADNSIYGAGSHGIFSGFDLDMIFLDGDGNLGTASDRIFASGYNFTTGTIISTSTVSMQPNASHPGPTFGSLSINSIDLATATLNARDGISIADVNSANGFLSLGYGGVLTANFMPTVAIPGSLFLMAGEVGDNGESLSAIVTASDSPIGVPEPATMLLLGSGLVGLAGFRRRFFKK